MTASLLYTRQDGPATGAPFLVIPDRNSDLDGARVLGELLGNQFHRIGVRGPRLQTTGGSGKTHGYYWHIGPLDRPELSSLGDGLYQFELLLLENVMRHPGRKIGLLGEGQGGLIALLSSLLWPEYLSAVIAIDAPLPSNLDDMPIAPRQLGGLPVLVSGQQGHAICSMLAGRGARATTTNNPPQRALVAEFLRKAALSSRTPDT